MLTITSPTTGKAREIPMTIERGGAVYHYEYTSRQANYRMETDWYVPEYRGIGVENRIGIQQPFMLLPFDTTGT